MNKYRFAVPDVGFPNSVEPTPIEGRFDGGLVLRHDAQHIQLNESPDLGAVRLEKNGLRSDYGRTLLGDASGLRILALGEHRFVGTDGSIFEKIFRLYRKASGKVRIESWDGAAWNVEIDEDDATGIGTADILLSWKSQYDSVFFADGLFVYRWDQSALIEDEGNDFPAGNLIGGYASPLTSATVTPGEAALDRYRVHYSLRIRSISINEGSVTIAILHAGVEVATKVRTIPVSTDYNRDLLFEHEIIQFDRPIANNDVVQLQVKEVSATPLQTGVTCIVADLTDQQVVVSDHPGFKAVADSYTVEFFFVDVSETGAMATIRISADFEDDIGNFINLHEASYAGNDPDDFSGSAKHSEVLDLSSHADKPNSWKIELIGETSATFFFPTDPQPSQSTDIDWQETVLAEVHGFNAAVDLDDEAGVTYSTTGAAVNDFFIMEKDGPENLLQGRFIGIFANRVLLLQDDGDVQKIRWPVSGDPSDWIGVGSGSFILESFSDPVDDLMGFEDINAGVGALFRKRSIMRVVSTGRPTPALAFYPWISDLGTDSPFSIRSVPGGVMFFGSDREVHFLTETGYVDVGFPISTAFKKLTDDQLSGIEAYYDPIDNEYVLTIPSAS